VIGSILGHPVRRIEDRRFLSGEARYVADMRADGALTAVFVRSPMPHARIAGVHAGEARSMRGVAGVFVGADLGLRPITFGSVKDVTRDVLARDVVRFVGEPVAVVLADSQAQAMDASEAVWVDYEPLPAVADPERAVGEGAPLLFPHRGSNVVRSRRSGPSHPLAGADVVVRERFVNQRLAPVPLEPNGIVAVPDGGTGGLTVWMPTQNPHFARDEIAEALGVDTDLVRVIAPAVGGGFGAKADTYPEQLAVAALAHRLGRSVRFTETRSENLVAMTHGRAQVQEIALGATVDGRLVGMDVHVVADMGAYPQGTFLPNLTRQMSTGVYVIPEVAFRADSVVTNTTPISSYRGAGRPEAAAMIERAMDLLAAELDMDPVELRRRNLISPEAFPWKTPTGATYDTGNYEAALDEALRLAGYPVLRGEQAERRRRGDRWQLGIGVSVYVEITGWGSEFGSVEVHADGTVTVGTGVSPHGQGHETSFAQVVADAMGVAFGAVRVVHSDTRLVPRGEGTSGSRSLQLGGSAVRRAGDAVVEKARRLAAHLLEASVEDVVRFDDGRIGIAGVPGRALTWAELATAASEGSRMPFEMEPGLAAFDDFTPAGNTFPFGAHVSVVEVDTETGLVRPLRHIAVDDCGRIVNPMLVEGQVHGGLAQGIAQALLEEVRFDEHGNPMNASLMAYEMPSAADLPSFERGSTVTPTPNNPLGAKGIGESATVGSTPAVQNAVVDAVMHLGVRHIDLPLSPERVWRAIRAARNAT
jgi:carbon-monoxide dehydrogenase large subunit